MTKEEFFEKNFKTIKRNVENGSSGCRDIMCSNCYLWKNKETCMGSHEIQKEFPLYLRKKKLEKLLS